MAFTESLTVVGVQKVSDTQIAVTFTIGAGPASFTITDSMDNAGQYVVDGTKSLSIS